MLGNGWVIGCCWNIGSYSIGSYSWIYDGIIIWWTLHTMKMSIVWNTLYTTNLWILSLGLTYLKHIWSILSYSWVKLSRKPNLLNIYFQKIVSKLHFTEFWLFLLVSSCLLEPRLAATTQHHKRALYCRRLAEENNKIYSTKFKISTRMYVSLTS